MSATAGRPDDDAPRRSAGAPGEASSRRGVILAVALVTLLSLALKGLFFLEPPGRDQSLFLTQAAMLLDGQALYSEIWEHKPPGIILLYALAMAVAGRSYEAVQVADWLALWATALGLLGLARAAGLGAAGLVASALYLVHASGALFGGYWATGQPEVWMDPLVVGALWLLFTLRPGRPGAPRAAVAVGAMVSAAILLKYSALPLAVGAVAALGWRCRGAGRAVGLKLLAALAAGGLAPALLLLAYLGATGGLADFWSSTVQFNLMHREVATRAWHAEPLANVLRELMPLLLLYLASAGALLAAWWGRGKSPRGTDRAGTPAEVTVWAALLWLLCLLQVFWQGKFWAYHYHVILLPLCLTAAAGLHAVVTLLRRWMPAALAVGLTVLVAAGLSLPDLAVWSGYLRRHGVLLHWTGGEVAQRTMLSYRRADYVYAETARLARRVARQVPRGEAIFVWGFEPGIYFQSERPAASRFLYDYPLMPRFAALHQRHVAALLDDLRRARPRLFIVGTRDRNDIEQSDSLTQLRALPALARYVKATFGDGRRVGRFVVFPRRAGAP